MTVHQPLSPGKYRVRVDDYLCLDEAGSFGDARTELIEGDIWVMSPAYTEHAKLLARLSYAVRGALLNTGSTLEAYVAPSVIISDDTMPEPDLVVGEDHDGGALPIGAVRIVAEVADTTLATDLSRKSALYARAGIPEYWIADVNGRIVHQLWAPSGDGYAQSRTVAFGAPIVSATLDGVTVDTAAL